MSATTTEVPAGTYTLEPVHSSFGFAVKHNGVSKFRGQFEDVTATLENGVLTGRAQVDSVKTPIPTLKDHLVGPDFFHAAETPTIEFRSNDIRISADGTVELDGVLTIRGVTQPVKATGTIAAGTSMSGEEVLGLELEATIDRRDFGINWQAPLPSGALAVAWEVTIEAQLELTKG